MTIKDFLTRYPYTENERALGKSIDFLWQFDLDASVAELWPHLIDTSTFNKLLELPVMKYQEKDGYLWGTSVNAGITLKWKEVPWEYEYQKTLSSARIYHEGFALYVRSRYLLESLPGNKTRLYVYFGWVPRGLKGMLILKWGFPGIKNKYKKGLDKVLSSIHSSRTFRQQQQKLQKESSQIEISDLAQQKLEEIKKSLLSKGLPSETVNRLIEHISTANDESLVRIKAKELSNDWGLPLNSLLATMLHATREGLFNLSWDVICPHCRGVREEISSLGDLVEDSNCETCDIDFSATAEDSLEVTFKVNPSIRKVEKKFFCAAEPATKRHIFLQKNLSPGSDNLIETELESGTYRYRLKGAKTYSLLEIEPQSSSSKVTLFSNETVDLRVSEKPMLAIRNRGPNQETLVIEKREEDRDALRPRDLFNLQQFHDLFSSESIASGLQLEIGVHTILFTDIVGSSEMYSTSGDDLAFKKVRNHFVKLYSIIDRFEGAVIKTIGDAAMVSFSSPLNAMKAAVELQKAFSKADAENVLLRISLHTGKCLAVNLNSNIDYFGATVNLAAKLQALPGAHEIVFSKVAYAAPLVKSIIQSQSLHLKQTDFSAPWLSQAVHAFITRIV